MSRLSFGPSQEPSSSISPAGCSLPSRLPIPTRCSFVPPLAQGWRTDQGLTKFAWRHLPLQEFIQSKLEMAYRTNLTKHVMGLYLGEEGDEGKGVFYKLGAPDEVNRLRFSLLTPLLRSFPGNLDDRIKNPDQMIVVDVCRPRSILPGC